MTFMKNILLSLALMLCPVVLAAQGQEDRLPYWQDVQTVEVNREYPRAAFMSYPDSATAAA